jgi:hypothetical protein
MQPFDVTVFNKMTCFGKITFPSSGPNYIVVNYNFLTGTAIIRCYVLYNWDLMMGM